LRPNTLDEYIDWKKLSETNVKKLNQLMKGDNLDGVIIDSMDSFRWLTGVPMSTAWFYRHTHSAIQPRGADEPVIIGLTVYDRVTRSWFKDVRTLSFAGELHQPLYADKWPDLCANAVKDCRISDGRIGLDPDTPYVLKEALANKLPNAEIVDAGDILKRGRVIKNEEEIKAIRVACAIGEMGMKAALEAIEEGKREREVAAEVVRALAYYGAEEVLGNLPLVCSGIRPYFLRASEKIIRYGEVIRVDLGCVYGGYYSDFSRTRYVGNSVPVDIKETYEALLEAHLAGIKAVKPGVTNAEVFNIVKNTLAELTKGKYDITTWGALLGHGIGVGIHEIPFFGMEVEEMKLEDGMYFCLEPTFWTPVGQIMIEDDLLVTKTGVEILTKTERGIEVLTRHK
jgi:Xaa-Pro aminopeptidase